MGTGVRYCGYTQMGRGPTPHTPHPLSLFLNIPRSKIRKHFRRRLYTKIKHINTSHYTILSYYVTYLHPYCMLPVSYYVIIILSYYYIITYIIKKLFC